MENFNRESHDATPQNVESSIYVMTPEEEEALLLEYGVSNVITDELLPQIAAPSQFQSEYGTRDVFLTAEAGNAHDIESRESSSSSDNDDDDDDDDEKKDFSNENRHKRRWRNVAKVCQLTRNDVFANTLQRLLIKYTSSYSYLTSETLLHATQSTMRDLQEQRNQTEQNAKKVQNAKNTSAQENHIFCNSEETMLSLENVAVRNTETDNDNGKEVIDDIITETDHLLREADKHINKTSQHDQLEEQENKSTNFLDIKLSELAYNALWTEKEWEVEEEEKVNKKMQMIESSSHSRESDNEVAIADEEVEELLADARKHIAQLRTIQKTCTDDMTSISNAINIEKTIEAHDGNNNSSDSNDKESNENTETERDKTIMTNVNNIHNETEEAKMLRYVQQERQQPKECKEEQLTDENEHITNAAYSSNTNEYHDSNTTSDNEANTEVETTNDFNKGWDVTYTEWENAYRTRHDNFRAVCGAQRVRMACYVDPVHLGESIECSSIAGRQDRSDVYSVQATDRENKQVNNSESEKSHFDVERDRHLSIMQSVHHTLEESPKEELNVNKNSDHKIVDLDYNDATNAVQLTRNQVTTSAKIDNDKEKATLFRSKESVCKEEALERRPDAEGFAILPSFVERIDKLLEPSRYEYAPETVSPIQTSSEQCCSEHEEPQKLQKSIELLKQKTQLDVAYKHNSSIVDRSTNDTNTREVEHKNILKSQLHASKQFMREKWRVEHELTEYHQLCKEDDEAQRHEIEYAIWLAECEDKLHECHANEYNFRLQLIEHEDSMRQELYASAEMHKQLIINVIRAKQEEKLKLLISYLEHEQNSEQIQIIHEERECWQTLEIEQEKEFSELYEAEQIERRMEEERRRKEAEEAERVYWLPENVRSRTLSQEEEIMQSWFVLEASKIQSSLDAIAEELTICCKDKREVFNKISVANVNTSSSTTITFVDREPSTSQKSEEKEKEQCLNSDMLITKLRQIALENNKLGKLSLSELTRYAYNSSFNSSHINQVDNSSLQNCHAKLSWTDKETNISLNDKSVNSSHNTELVCTTLVRDVDLSENILEKLQLAALLRLFPAIQVLKLNKNNLTSLAANLIDFDNINSGSRSLRSVKAVYDNAISEQTRLHTLDVSHNRLTCVDEIATLLPRTLTRLYARGNAITSIAPLVTCTRLQELELSHNAIHSLNGLHTLRLLREIDISYNTSTNDDPKASKNYNKEGEECDLSPICNNCLLLQKLYLSHNDIRVLLLDDPTHYCSSRETKERQEECLEKQQKQKQCEWQQQRTEETLTREFHCAKYEYEEEKEKSHFITHVKPNVFLFMTELHMDHNQLVGLSVENMPYLPMLSVLHAEHNAITDISGLMHCPRLMYVDLSHNELATWKDLRPIMYCEHLIEVNLLCNPCFHSASDNNEQSILESYAKNTKNKLKNSEKEVCCAENNVEQLLVRWLPKLQKLNNMCVNNHSDAMNAETSSLVNIVRTSETRVKPTTGHELKECNNITLLALDKSICEVRELLQHLDTTHASRISAVEKWETQWRQESLKRNVVNYISPDPQYVHQLKLIANVEELTFLQYSLEHYVCQFQLQQDKATEEWSKLTEFVHKNTRLFEQEQIAHVTLCKWLQKYISVWRAKRQLAQLRQEMKIKEQHAKWMSALYVLQPVGRGAILRMRLRHVLLTRFDAKQNCSAFMEHHTQISNLTRSDCKDNSAALAHDDDDKLYVKVNEELPQLLQSISCTGDTDIVNLLRKVNVKQIPVPKLPLIQTSSSSSAYISTSALLSQSANNANKSTKIDQCSLSQTAQTQREKSKVNDEKTQIISPESKEQTSLPSEKTEICNEESSYSAIVSAQMAKKRKKMNRQQEQVMKEEFIRDPLKVKKMRQKDQIM